MNLQPRYSPIWKKLITGEMSCDFEFLATKIFLGRARLVQISDTSDETLVSLANELFELFEKNKEHPAVLRDLERIR